MNLFAVEKKQTQCSDCSIRRLALCNGVGEDEADWIQGYRHNQFKIKAKKTLYKENKPTKHIYTLYHGWVLQYKTLPNGKRQVLRIALPGDLLGFQAHLDGPMSHSALALCDAVLCAFTNEDKSEMLNSRIDMTKRLIDMHARDTSLQQNHLVGVGQKTAEERIAHLCMELFYRVRAIRDDSVSQNIELPLTQEDIGDYVGLTQIHVNRTLKVLREQGLMEIKNKRLYILNENKLKELSLFDEKTLQMHTIF